jgi:hypothetical protein
MPGKGKKNKVSVGSWQFFGKQPTFQSRLMVLLQNIKLGLKTFHEQTHRSSVCWIVTRMFVTSIFFRLVWQGAYLSGAPLKGWFLALLANTVLY